MKRTAIFLGLIVYATTLLFGQVQSSADSLRRLIPYQQVESARIQLKVQLGELFEPLQPDSALFWYNQAIPQAIGDSTLANGWYSEADDAERYLVALALVRRGELLLKREDYNGTLADLLQAYDFAKGINHLPLAAYCANKLGLCYSVLRNNQQAIGYYEQSLEINQKLNDLQGIADCLSNLSGLNARQGNFSEAANYLLSLLHLHDGYGPGELMDYHSRIAWFYQQQADYGSAVQHWKQALDISERYGRADYGKILSGLGFAYYHLGDMEGAQKAYQNLIEYSALNQDDRNRLTALHNLAMIYTSVDEVDKAVEHWEGAYEVARLSSNTPLVMEALLNLSNLYSSHGIPIKAADFFERYLNLVKEYGTSAELASAYLKSGQLYDRVFRYDDSFLSYQAAKELYRQADDNEGAAQAAILLAKSYALQGQNTLAKGQLDLVLLNEGTLHPQIVATAYQVQGELWRQQLQFSASAEAYQKALAIWLTQNQKMQSVECLNAMASLFETIGDLPRTIKHYREAIQIAQELENKEVVAFLYNNIGITYRLLGDYAKAKESYHNALSIEPKGEYAEQISYAYNNLGIIYEQEGAYDLGIESYEKSIAIKEQYNDLKGLATGFINLGNLYRRINRDSEALEVFQKALAIARQQKDRESEAYAYGNLAACYIDEKNYDVALEYSLKNLEIAEAIDLRLPMKEAYRQLAWIYENTQKWDLAQEHYGKIIDMNRKEIDANFTVLSENEKELFFRTIADDYDRFYAFAYGRQYQNPQVNAELYNAILTNKGLLLKSGTAMNNTILSSDNPRVIEMYNQWVALKQELARQYGLPAHKRSDRLQNIEVEANDLERELVILSSDFSSYQGLGTHGWTDIRDGLQVGEAAIEFAHFKAKGDSTYYAALIVTKQSDYPLFCLLFEEKRLEELIGSVGGSSHRFILNLYGTLANPNTQLYELIWQPLEPYLQGYKKVYYSPAGLLHKISFAALSKGNGHVLLDDYQLMLVSTTANSVGVQHDQMDGMSQIALFGGIQYNHKAESGTWHPLEGTQKEIELIASLFADRGVNVVFLNDTLAKEENFKRVSPKSDILHIATHGFFYPDPEKQQEIMEMEKEIGHVQFRGATDHQGGRVFIHSENPLMRSGLIFAGANDYWSDQFESLEEDGILTSLEVLNIDLRKNRLVVMSACETGLGDIHGSEGVYGLQRAFRMAGASKIIMSLWQVPDTETAEFMRLFYTQLIQTNSIQEAFATAQLQMRKKYDPFLWAAFVLLE